MTTPTQPRTARIELTISGMTCGSCANRVAKVLNGIDGVTATVNLAQRTARIDYPAETTPADLVAAVDMAGYGATVTTPGPAFALVPAQTAACCTPRQETSAVEFTGTSIPTASTPGCCGSR